MGKAEELAAAVEGLESGKGKRRKYPLELRQRLVEFVREQRKLIGDMEQTLSQTLCELHRKQLNETNAADAQSKDLLRYFRNEVVTSGGRIKDHLVQYNEHLRTLVLYHQAYCETIPRKTPVL